MVGYFNLLKRMKNKFIGMIFLYFCWFSHIVMSFAYWKFFKKSVWFKFSQALIKQIEYILFFTIVNVSLQILYGDINSENVPYISDIKINYGFVFLVWNYYFLLGIGIHLFKISITVEVKRFFLSQVKIISLYYCNFNNGANYLGIN